MDEIALIVLLIALILLATPIALIILFVKSHNKHEQLQQQIDRLRKQMIEIKQTAPVQTAPVQTAPVQTAPVQTAPAEMPPAPVAEAPHEPATKYANKRAPEIIAEVSVPGNKTNILPHTAKADTEAQQFEHGIDEPIKDLTKRGIDAIVSYFADGNLFVRIGILVLFFGVAFLLKFAAEYSTIPIELRFIGAAIGGVGLMLFGWRLRNSKRTYALLLQGGGIGVTYITIFAAFRLAQLLPSALTFGLLVFFAAFTVALAVVQNSCSLATYALIGGFLAPFLASTGSGNYIGLFSYYTILNTAVLCVAWFRAWRILNRLGFVFTFAVFALWIVSSYTATDLYPTLGFLTLFFLMYSLIGLLYALRQPENVTGMVDSTLLFGTPVTVSSLLMFLLHEFDFGIAGATAGMGVYYLILARYTWRHIGETFRLLTEAMLAIGVVFITLAIPYALDGHWSSAAWALEAAGILWVSIRQKRFYAQCFAIVLQVSAGVLFFMDNASDVGHTAWMNPAFLGGTFIALGALISARMLYLQDKAFQLRPLHSLFYIWGMAWWLGSALVQINQYVHHDLMACLLLFGGTAAALVYFDRVRQWNWMPASINATLLLPTLLLLSFVSIQDNGQMLVNPDGWFWMAALAVNYWIIEKLETVDWPENFSIAQHVAFVVFISLFLSLELFWLVKIHLSGYGSGYQALITAVPLLSIYAAQKRWFPAIKRFSNQLQWGIIGALSTFLLLWSLGINFSNNGSPAPLLYVPFLNPIDLVHLIFFLLALGSLKQIDNTQKVKRDHILIALASLIFIWLTAVLIRSMHHYMAIPFDIELLVRDTRVQTSISILWTVIGISAMWFASRQTIRSLWITGACLIGVVLVKMFFVDLGASGTVERIVSFLVVGSLLVAIGYFSPIPPKQDSSRPQTGGTSHV